MIAILMGVTGSGKTTVAKAVVAVTGWLFAEGDDYHSAGNIAKMAAGIPLTDEDREPWLRALHAVLVGWQRAGESGVMTCSALKQSYRDLLVEGMPPGAVSFVLLQVPLEVLKDRLAHRPNHFMNPALLTSQLQTLEEPKDALRIRADRPAVEVAEELVARLRE